MKKCLYLGVIFLLVIQLSGCQGSLKKVEGTDLVVQEQKEKPGSAEVEQENMSALDIKADREEIKTYLTAISNNIRHYSLPEEKEKGVEYITDTASAFGYEAEIQEFDIYKIDLETAEFIKNTKNILDVNPMNSEKEGVGKNIILAHPGNAEGKRNFYLTAHYDTTKNTTGVIDNGTGSAVLLELANKLFCYNGELNLFFIFFDAEEVSQQGAKAFVREYIETGSENEAGCINVDMAGEVDAEQIMMKFGCGEHNVLSLMWQQQMDKDIEVMLGASTDEIVFFYNKIPAVTFANKLPDFSLDKESREVQLEHIDYGQMEQLANDIIKFVAGFDIELYEEILTDREEKNSLLDMEKIYRLDGTEYIDRTSQIVDNGYISETVVDYKYGKEDFSISMISGRFFERDALEDYLLYIYPGTEEEVIFVDGDINVWQFYYKIIREDGDCVDIEYYNGQHTGMIRNINRDILQDIIYSFQKAVINQEYY